MFALWKRQILSATIVVATGLAILPAASAQAQTAQRCFSETGFCIEGRIREFWEQNGGLPVFGLPIGPQQAETIEGKSLQVQRFERNRLELHPENGRPYDVLLGRLGADRLAQQGRDWQAEFTKSSAAPGCRFFAETGHNVCGEILTAWRASGLELDGKGGKTEAENLALFGLPLSDLHTETMADGQQRQVQWFERARFELHPENAAPYNVQLGLLGNEIRDGGSVAAQPTAQPADPCADVHDPVNGRIRPAKCVAKGTQIEIDVYGFQPNEQVGYWLNAPGDIMIGTEQTVSIGPSGSVTGLPFNTSSLPAGQYSMVFQSAKTGYQAIVYFKVMDAGAAAPAPTAAPQTGVPASQDAAVQPISGAQGTKFTAVGTGFKSGENIGVYITEPGGSVFGAPFQVQANDSGTSDVVSVYTDSSWPAGVYAISFEGVKSHHKAIAYFQITK